MATLCCRDTFTSRASFLDFTRRSGPSRGAGHLAPTGFFAHHPSEQAFKSPEGVELSVAKVLENRDPKKYEDMFRPGVGMKGKLLLQHRANRQQRAQAYGKQKEDYKR